MSSKKYRGKLCVYCSQRPAITGDHIFAREFFVHSQRANLPQAPTCDLCNFEKSKLEHYLTTVLPFGGRHSTALENLSEHVPPRLSNNLRLHRSIQSNAGIFWSNWDGIYQPTPAIPIDSEKMIQLFGFITRGLIWFHWDTYLNDSYEVDVLILSRVGKKVLHNLLFEKQVTNRVDVTLGEDTIHYEGLQADDYPQITAWRFDFYGGIRFAGGLMDAEGTDAQIASTTFVNDSPKH